MFRSPCLAVADPGTPYSIHHRAGRDSTPPVTALSARPFSSALLGPPPADEEGSLAAYRRLARLVAGTDTAGIYLLHDAGLAGQDRVTCEGMSGGEGGRIAMLARRVMLADEPSILSSGDAA